MTKLRPLPYRHQQWHWTEETPRILAAVCPVIGTWSPLRPQIHRWTASQWTRHDEQRDYLSRKHNVSQLHRPQRWSFSEIILRSYESCERLTLEAKTQRFLSVLAEQLRKLSMNSVIVCLSIYTYAQNSLTPSPWIFVTFYIWNV